MASVLLTVLTIGSVLRVAAQDAAVPAAPRSGTNSISTALDRSPVDVVLSPDESWLLAVNQGASSVSLVQVSDGRIVSEVTVGEHPSQAAVTPDGRMALVTATYAGTVEWLEVRPDGLRHVGSLEVGFHPTGIALTRDGKLACVSLTASGTVVVIDVARREVVKSIEVGKWPRYLDVSADGKRLAVGTSGDRSVTVVDLEAGKADFQVNRFKGLNIGHVRISEDGQHAWFPWMHYGENIPSPGNIRRGWVLGNRLGRIRLDRLALREALSLDKEGEAVADAFGLALSPDESRLVISASGTHELLSFRVDGIPLTKVGGTEHIPQELLADSERYCRIPVGGRPMGLRFASDQRTVYVANYLENSVQIVDVVERRLVRAIPLGGPAEPSLARRGAAIFYDGRRSFDQWYSCHSCHYDGGVNAELIDTHNDGSAYTFKTVLPLYRIDQTGPWTWHGRQVTLDDALRGSLVTTMVGPKPSDDDVKAMVEFVKTLEPPPNPHRSRDGALSDAARRGEAIFRGDKANCATCHAGPQTTDGENHDVGLAGDLDRFSDFNTPSLRNVALKVRWLHDGRAKSLHELLTGAHRPDQVTGRGALSEQEVADLIEYLKTL